MSIIFDSRWPGGIPLAPPSGARFKSFSIDERRYLQELLADEMGRDTGALALWEEIERSYDYNPAPPPGGNKENP